MSTPLGSSQFFLDAAPEPSQSLRFEDGDSADLSWSPASTGNLKTFTISLWLKRANITAGYILRASEFYLYYTSDGALNYYDYRSGANGVILTTNAVYRDPSAWYHIVLASDRTQSIAADRVKLYVNGEQITSFSTATYPTTSENSYFNNSANTHYLGGTSSNYFDGYLAAVCFIDGTALDPTSFGEYNNTLWKPKNDLAIRKLTFGTNGFYLNFEDSSAIGDDTSGNSNDWTVSNLVATDVVLDSPVNGGNFPTLNALTYSGLYALTLSEGNLNARDATGIAGWKSRWSTFAAPTSGKWYAEFYLKYIGTTAFSNQAFVGLHDGLAGTTYIGQSSGSYGYIASGGTYNNGTHTSSYGLSYTNGDIIGLAWDADNGDLTFYKNGVSQGIAYSSVSAENKFFGVSAFWVYPDGQTYLHCNFGQDSSFAGQKTAQGNTDDNGVGDFYYTPPSGYLCLKTSSLPAATITAPDEYFNTVLYTGTGTTDQSITGVGFQPDFTWIKSRSNTYYHWLSDAVRGAGKALVSNTTGVEDTTLPIFLSFDSDGFTVDVDTATANNTTNGSGATFVAWNWLAGNGTSSNSQGSIASTVSANQTAGFSIVSWTDDASTSSTVGHGLNSAPELIITKNRDGAFNWFTWTTVIDGSYDYVSLNRTDSKTDDSSRSLPTSSVFTNVGSTSGDGQIAYCFHSVDGYSKIGSYTGNGTTDGPFVHCGFRPAWVMVKSSTNNTASWQIYDNNRSPYNVSNNALFPNLDNIEYSNSVVDIDFTSNGFKIRGTNTNINSNTAGYIFLAFAEAPFKLANAR